MHPNPNAPDPDTYSPDLPAEWQGTPYHPELPGETGEQLGTVRLHSGDTIVYDPDNPSAYIRGEADTVGLEASE